MNINELHKLAVGGDSESENALFQNLTARFRLFAKQRIWNAQDAEEIAQDALTTIVEKYRSIEFRTSFSSWAHEVLKNKIMNYVKKKKSHESKLGQIAAEQMPAGTTQSNPDFEFRLLDCLRKILESNARYARALNFHYQGYSVADICQKLDVTDSNFYSVLSRARSMLEQCLDKGDIR